ncbi:MAG: 30S ribosomal protein S12 methylthiotransferase RimO [Ruminococcaceae bacterium]|nr:30S ribosomal protein S12 methylthiotransferase RimO [Oscillospiraceae bacterium]
MKIGFISLGCPKNQLDTEVMLHELMAAGHEITPDETEADIVVVNTCAFIESAKKEAIDNILDVAWLKENRSLRAIIVTGCLAERYREEIFAELPEVDALLGVGSIHNIVKAVEDVQKRWENKKHPKYASFEDKNTVRLGGDRVLTTPEYYSYLKIGEGCDNCCTYCAIPAIRGRFRSRPIEDLVAEAKDLDALGVKELNIVAQDVTRYGQDLYGSYQLHTLLRRITEETNIPWIRLLYCYPDKITDELIAEIRDNDRVVKYIDMPLQHISDPILRAMNRHGDSAMITSVIEKLRREIPDITIRTTFIVGFPGETEADFEQLCQFVEDTKFEHMGVFAYSPEEGTAAAKMANQIDEQLKQDRADILMRAQMEITAAQNEKKIGSTVRVLVEDFDPVSEAHFGRSAADAPEIDGKVYFKADRRVAPGSMIDVKVREVLDYDLYGRGMIPKEKTR